MRPRRGRPSDPQRQARRRRFIGAILHEAPSLEAAMRESGISPVALIRLLEEIGVTPRTVLELLDQDEDRAAA